MRKKVGLTGGMGSGKSVVAKIFETLGIPVFNADTIAKKLMEEDIVVQQKIVQLFGANTYHDGKLNRAFLAGIVFHDKIKLTQLNNIVHPATIAAAGDWMEQQTAPYMIKEAALIFEAGAEKHLDLVVGVFAPKEIRIKRVMERDKISKEQAEARMKNQMDDIDKMNLCDHVIINDEKQLIIPQVLKIHQIILNSTKRIL
ncbi:MAG: dephospho-CoA kinase [Chitinophagaceae bacterium]